MYSFGGEGKERYCFYEVILEYVSEAKIVSFYMGHPIKFNNNYRSPFREDKKPSIAFYPRKGDYVSGTVYDFSRPGPPITIPKFIQNLLELENYYDTLDQINHDLEIGLFYIRGKEPKTKNSGYTGKVDENQDVEYNVEGKSYLQGFTKRDEIFWNNFGISLETLKKFKVYSTQKLRLPNGNSIVYSIGNPIYTYYFPSNKSKKIYMPLNRRGAKFLVYGDIPIQGYEQLPKSGDLLIITKSLKDVMLLYELGYTAIAPNSETVGLDYSIFEDLRERFKNIVLFYDNDETGLKSSKVFSEIYNIPYIVLPEEDSKDISDYYYIKKSHKICKEKIENLIKNVI